LGKIYTSEKILLKFVSKWNKILLLNYINVPKNPRISHGDTKKIEITERKKGL